MTTFTSYHGKTITAKQIYDQLKDEEIACSYVYSRNDNGDMAESYGPERIFFNAYETVDEVEKALLRVAEAGLEGLLIKGDEIAQADGTFFKVNPDTRISPSSVTVQFDSEDTEHIFDDGEIQLTLFISPRGLLWYSVGVFVERNLNFETGCDNLVKFLKNSVILEIVEEYNITDEQILPIAKRLKKDIDTVKIDDEDDEAIDGLREMLSHYVPSSIHIDDQLSNEVIEHMVSAYHADGGQRQFCMPPKIPPPPAKLNALTTPHKITDSLADFLHETAHNTDISRGTMLSHYDIMKHLNAYIEKKNLQNPNDVREILYAKDPKFSELIAKARGDNTKFIYLDLIKVPKTHFID